MSEKLSQGRTSKMDPGYVMGGRNRWCSWAAGCPSSEECCVSHGSRNEGHEKKSMLLDQTISGSLSSMSGKAREGPSARQTAGERAAC